MCERVIQNVLFVLIFNYYNNIIYNEALLDYILCILILNQIHFLYLFIQT